jgi:hypothetical protein
MNAALPVTSMLYSMIFTLCIWITLRQVEPKKRRRLFDYAISTYGPSFDIILRPCMVSCQRTISVAVVVAVAVKVVIGPLLTLPGWQVFIKLQKQRYPVSRMLFILLKIGNLGSYQLFKLPSHREFFETVLSEAFVGP